MNKLYYFVWIFLAIVTLPAAASAQLQQGQKVAVLDFKVIGSSEAEAKKIASTLSGVTSQELKSFGFKVITFDDIRAMLSLDKTKVMLGCGDESCIAEIGGALGSDLMLSGSVTKIGAEYKLSISLVDVARARVLERFLGTAGSFEVLSETARRGLQILFKKKADLSGRGTLFIQTDPVHAQVLVDGVARGTAPVTLDEMAAGEHKIEAKKNGLSAQLTFLLKPGAMEKLTLQLKTSPPVKLKIFSRPPEAEVYVDERRIGTSPTLIEELTSNETHRIRFSLPHYQDVSYQVNYSYEEFERKGRRAFRLDAELRPLPVDLILHGLPSGSVVYIDGQEIHGPPYQITPGERRILVKVHGYKNMQGVLNPRIGQMLEEKIDIEMLPEYQQFMDDLALHETVRTSAFVAGGLSAAATAGAFVLAYFLWQEAGDSHVAYEAATDVARMNALFEHSEQQELEARVSQFAGMGAAAVSLLGFAGGVISWWTTPGDPIPTHNPVLSQE